MKSLVTGANGQLGSEIIRQLIKNGELEENILGVDIDILDITDKEAVEKAVNDFMPDVIYHCAAWTAVDKAEEDEHKEKVYAVNVDGTKYLSEAAKKIDATIIYISTDYVFDGTGTGEIYPDDQANPQSYYGQTKYLGEKIVVENPKHYIVRTTWVFGNGANIVRSAYKFSQIKDELTFVNDQVASPTYTKDLARLLIDMANSDKYGTYHATNEGFCNLQELAQFTAATSGSKAVVNGTTTKEFYQNQTGKNIATRPLNSRLNKDKLEENGFKRLPNWKDAITEYIELLKKEEI